MILKIISGYKDFKVKNDAIYFADSFNVRKPLPFDNVVSWREESVYIEGELTQAIFITTRDNLVIQVNKRGNLTEFEKLNSYLKSGFDKRK